MTKINLKYKIKIVIKTNSMKNMKNIHNFNKIKKNIKKKLISNQKPTF